MLRQNFIQTTCKVQIQAYNTMKKLGDEQRYAINFEGIKLRLLIRQQWGKGVEKRYAYCDYLFLRNRQLNV